MSGQVFADYEQRTFKVCFNNETRKLQQYHFSSWPDHGVPLYSQSLVPFLQKIQQIPLDSKSPVVVHCSAGVGRTGTILLCDICLRMAAKEDAVDVLRTLQQLRDQRANMVDNIQQYKLAHLVILECLVGKQTGIPCSEIETEVKKLLSGDRITQQMRYLKDTAWQDKTMKSVASNDAFVVVQEKNRFQNIVPGRFRSLQVLHDDPFFRNSRLHVFVTLPHPRRHLHLHQRRQSGRFPLSRQVHSHATTHAQHAGRLLEARPREGDHSDSVPQPGQPEKQNLVPVLAHRKATRTDPR
jgi:protein-tyrosine phosphatase